MTASSPERTFIRSLGAALQRMTAPSPERSLIQSATDDLLGGKRELALYDRKSTAGHQFEIRRGTAHEIRNTAKRGRDPREHILSEREFFNGLAKSMSFEGLVDNRGELLAIEHVALPFPPARTFVVCAPTGAVRGGHAHKIGKQLLIALSGTVKVDLWFQETRQSIVLDRLGRGVLIEPGVWARQTYLGECASLLVFCDTPYDQEDYVIEMPK